MINAAIEYRSLCQFLLPTLPTSIQIANSYLNDLQLIAETHILRYYCALIIHVMIFEAIVFLVATALIAVIIDEQTEPKTSLPRVGSDPGPFNLLKWWARWKWLQHGHENVVRAYETVYEFNLNVCRDH